MPDNPPFEIKEDEMLTFADIYRTALIQRLKLASYFANAIHDKLIVISLADDTEREQKISELKELTNMYLALVGFNERWFYDFSKSVINAEMGLYGGITGKLMPEYLGDLIANLERYNILKQNREQNLGVLLATVLSLLGVRISPDLIEKIVELLKKELGSNHSTA